MAFDRKKLFAYAAVALVVLSIGARMLLSHMGGGGATLQGVSLGAADAMPSASGGPIAPAARSSPSAPAAALVVDVRGAIASPGVYQLPAGARVCDLIEAAGGPLAGADLAAVNPAAKLADGQQVVVPKLGEAPGPSSGGAAPNVSPGPVNLNTATMEELDALPGVGPSTAQKIIEYREANGGFRGVEDLKNVSGIGDARYESLKDLVTV